MANYKPKLPDPDMSSAESWKGKFIRDALANELGFVIDVVEDKEGIRLLAKFPGQKRPRKISLEPRDDGEFIFPGNVKARYRPPSREDRERIARATGKPADN